MGRSERAAGEARPELQAVTFRAVEVDYDFAAMIFNVRRGPRAEDVQTFYWPVYDFLEPVIVVRPLLTVADIAAGRAEAALATKLRGAAALNGLECFAAWRSGLSARMAA